MQTYKIKSLLDADEGDQHVYLFHGILFEIYNIVPNI